MRLAFTLLLSILSWHATAQVQEFTLDNGLKILVKEDHRAPVAVTMLWYNVGSADEPGGITGVSHALEHMMFKGTKAWPAGAFSRKIAAIGGQENALTNYDYTAYYEKIAASQLPVTLELEADRMQNLLLSEEEFAKEIKVIQEERLTRTDDNPKALTMERYLAASQLSDPYHHPVIGWMSDLQQMRVEDVRAWYQGFYAPNNATLVVVGDVNPDNVHQLAKLYFSNIPQRPQFVRKKQTEPPALGAKSVQVHAPASTPMYMFGYTVPSLNTAQTDWEPYALELITGLLDAGDSARFATSLVRGKELASSVDVYYNLYARYQTQFIFYGSPSRFHNVNQLRDGILAEIRKLQQTPVGDAELKRIKLQIIAEKTFEKDSIFGQAMELGLLETIGLGWQAADTYQQRINAVTAEQIQAAAKRWFDEKTMTEATLFPLSNPEERS